MIRALLLAVCIVASPVWAHDLRVFASVRGQIVTVEAMFSSGRVPTGGEVRVLDADDVLLMTLEIGADGMAQFELPARADKTGLMIEVDVSEGHSDYWMLTPDDIAHGQVTN